MLVLARAFRATAQAIGLDLGARIKGLTFRDVRSSDSAGFGLGGLHPCSSNLVAVKARAIFKPSQHASTYLLNGESGGGPALKQCTVGSNCSQQALGLLSFPRFRTLESSGVDGIPPGMNDSQYDFSQVQRWPQTFRLDLLRIQVQEQFHGIRVQGLGFGV